MYRPNSRDYLKKINELVHKKNDLRSALEVLHIEMKDQLVKPEQAHYRVLIHACAVAGYTRKAFELHREYRSRGLPRHVGMVSVLKKS